MDMLTFEMSINGITKFVMAPDRRTAIKVCEADYRRANNLPASACLMASVIKQVGVVPVTQSGLIGVR